MITPHTTTTSRSPIGRLLRAPLRALPENTVVRALSGPMMGMRWITGSSPHGAWLGILEREKLRSFVGNLKPGMTVWDIGANVGLYTLPSARAVGRSGHIYSFEPLPRNCEYLRSHILLNKLSNVVVVPTAVYDAAESIRMAAGDSPSEFHLDPHGEVSVPAIGLDAWRTATNSPPPNAVKIDVEGAEAGVLRSGSETFPRYKPLVYLALHGENQRRECHELLTGWGYEIKCEAGIPLSASSEWTAKAS
jgi:FkbM family methyltransferase